MKSTILILGLLFLFACGDKIDNNSIENIERFKTAKDIIFNNRNIIIKAVNYQENDSLRHEPYSGFSSNRYYFENTIVKGTNNEVKKVLSLWDDKLISDDVVDGKISLSKDSILIFQTKVKRGLFSYIGHNIIYDPHDNNGGLGLENSEILKKQDLGGHWTYIIEKNYIID